MKGSFFRPLSATVRGTAAVCIMLLLPAPGNIAFGFAREGTCDDNPFPDVNPGPGSLKRIRPIDPPQLSQYVKDRQAAIVLGKALFWDMQVGSDGIQSCATCHFRAGADPRSKGQLAFGGANNTRESVDLGVNYQLKADDFPLHKLADPTDRKSKVLRTSDDVVSSAGVKKTKFHGATRGASQDNTSSLVDSVYNVGGVNTRRAEPRNTPTVINTAFKRRQFWDGRADEIFNGVDPFGVRNPDAHVLKATSLLKLEPAKVRITFAAAASQAVGPPLSELEMGSIGRTFKDVGKRLVWATPLAQQIVAADDSVLGPYSKSRAMGSPQKGLTVTYAELIAKAFRPEWWLSSQVAEFSKDGSYKLKPLNLPLDDNEFTQAEFNFSLFFGLAIQLYEMTLISDDAPIDRFFEGNRTALTKQQMEGLALAEEHACVACHSGAEFFNSSARIIYGAEGEPAEIIERMPNGNCEVVIYDQSFYNIGVRPWEEDLGIGVNDPFGNPLAISKLLTMPPSQVNSKELLTIPYPNVASPPPALNERISTTGNFAVPTLRNIALTAPYFHHGGQGTLKQAVQFYNRGGDFREHNAQFVDFEIGKLSMTDKEIDAIVAFLHSLTDERVLLRKAPFDHPQLFVPNGAKGDHRKVQVGPDGTALDDMMEVPAVGKNGGPPLKGFLE